jgi:2,4-dienoyl-CoA reductase (NADPH2)
VVVEARAPTPAFETLFTPFSLGALELKNRIVAAPHGTAMTDRGVPTDDDIAFWEARAAGGVAAMITGATTTHRSGVLRDRRRAEPWNADSLRQMAHRAERVHRHGAAMFCQLNHLGREGVGGASEYAPIAPSAIRSPRDASTPHPLTLEEIEELIESFVSGAVNVLGAGYDGIELHAAHGYLIAQFLSAASNRRDDAYGGELRGRMRFLERIIAGIRERCGADRVLGVRLSADEEVPEGMHLDDTVAIARRLAELGGVDYLSITLGQRGAYVKDITHREGVAVDAAEAVKQATSLAVLVAGRIVDPTMAEAILNRGAADLVGMARQLIVDPQWPTKAASGMTRSIRPCIGVNQECRTFPGGILCAASARTGRERWFEAELRAPRKQKMRLAVIGGGPAGLEAARFAAELGASVVLYEREDRVGGQLRLAAAVSSRAGVFALVSHLEHEVRRLGVEVCTGTEITPAHFADTSHAADAIIVATGARPLEPAFERDGSAGVVTVWDVLGGARFDGDRAVVADDGTGFWEAVSAAELLADAGVSVALVTPARSVGAAIPFESIGPLLRRLGERRVALHSLMRVTRVRDSMVSLSHNLTGDSLELRADFIAAHAGTISNDELVAKLPADESAIVRTIGDCVSPRRLTYANWDADRIVLELMRADSQPRPSPRAW